MEQQAFSGGEMVEEERRPQEHTGMASVISRILGREESEGSVILSKLHRKRPNTVHTKSSGESSGEGEEEGEEECEGEGEREGGGGTVHKTSHSDVVKSCHKLPDSSSLEVERKLQRIATQGVVQLFNAVSKQQKELESQLKKAGPSERKKTKVMSSVDKGSFIDMLKGKAETRTQKTKQQVQKSKPEGQLPSWSILRDDYMKGSKFKDWDRQSDCDQSDDTSDDNV